MEIKIKELKIHKPQEEKPIDLEKESAEHLFAQPQHIQDIVTDCTDRLVELLLNADKDGIEFSEGEMIEIIIRTLALNLYLIDRERGKDKNEGTV